MPTAFRSVPFISLFGASFLINASVWLLVLAKILPLRAERAWFVLHATVYFGIDRIGPWTETLLPPGLGLLVFAVNLGIAILLFRRHRPLAYLVGAATVAIEAFLLLGAVGLVRFNTL